jgi:antitoxin component of MazEF toxin-antitoxin module
MDSRLRIGAGGSLKLPRELLERLNWGSGSYINVAIEGDCLKLRRVEVDPFAEAARPPDPDAFDRLLKQQRDSQSKAFKTFDEKMKKPPEVRPEDRPDFWR